MKNIRGIRHQPSDEAPVSFCDVVDSFSEEEWKLLQLWQKELYNNLMKELQQAFNSLGPLIATSVFSLKPKVKEGICSVKLEDIDTIDNVNLYSGYLATESEMTFGENQYLKGSPDAGEHRRLDVANTGTSDMAADVSFCIKREEEMYSNFENSESISCTTRIEVSAIGTNDVEEVYSIDMQNDLRGESSNSHLGLEVVAISTNDVEEVYPIDMQDDQRGESSNNHLGKGNMNTKGNIANTFSNTERPRLCKTPVKMLKANMIQGENPKSLGSLMWTRYDGELQEDIRTQSQTGFHQQVKFSLQKTVPCEQPSEIYENHESMVRTDDNISCEINIPCEKSTQQSPECDLTYQRDSTAGYQQAHQLKMRYPKVRYPCTECGKTLLGMSSLIVHQRIHTGEKPFLCTVCGKRFKQKGALRRHQRVHTGARPYHCKVCQKNFTQKCHLQSHERRHIITKIL